MMRNRVEMVGIAMFLALLAVIGLNEERAATVEYGRQLLVCMDITGNVSPV